jgi:hypothetical protein
MISAFGVQHVSKMNYQVVPRPVIGPGATHYVRGMVNNKLGKGRLKRKPALDRQKVAKARRGATGGRHRPGYPSMQHRGGEGYYNPTSEQVAASRARRAAQQAHSADPDRRRKVGRKVPLRHHWRAAGRLPKATAAALATGGGSLYALDRNVSKSDQDRNIALGAAGGASLTYAGSNIAGQAAKATLKSRRAKRGESPNEKALWRRHKAETRNSLNTYLKYPKELPDWRGQRALAFKNRPAVAATTLAAGTAAGGAYGARKGGRRGRSDQH